MPESPDVADRPAVEDLEQFEQTIHIATLAP
jgi:hypothetical protein